MKSVIYVFSIFILFLMTYMVYDYLEDELWFMERRRFNMQMRAAILKEHAAFKTGKYLINDVPSEVRMNYSSPVINIEF